MKYVEYQEQRSKEFAALPLFFAFNEVQFYKELEERGLKAAEVRSLGLGGYYAEKDTEVIREFFNKPNPLLELMEDPTFAEDAFYYEMQNHEYCINWEGDYDVCSCFGTCEYAEQKNALDYLREMGYSENVVKSWDKARRKYMAEDWY